MEFKEGQILNFTWKSFYGKLIQVYNYREYKKKGPTHSAIIGEVKEYSVIVYEAINSGFQAKEYGKEELRSYIKSGNCVVGETYIKLNNVKENCEKYLGAPYAWTDIFYIALYVLIGKSAFKLSTNAKNLICSEAVTRVLYDSSNKQINFENEYNKPYSFIAPSDIQHSKYIKWLN